MNIKVLEKNLLPRLFVTERAAATVAVIVELCPEEVGWMGLMRIEGQPGDENYHILLDNPYVPSQEVAGATCDLDPDGEGSFFEWAMTLPDEDKPCIKWWGHSHVNMGVNPSQTDMSTFWEHVENDPLTPFVMTVHNKQRDVYANLYLGSGIYIENAPIRVLYQDVDIYTSVAEQLKQNVRKKTYAPKKPAATGFNQTNWNNSQRQIGFHKGEHNWSGSNWVQPSQPTLKTRNEESNAMGFRQGGGTQPAKPSVRPKRSGKKQSRSNGRASAK